MNDPSRRRFLAVAGTGAAAAAPTLLQAETAEAVQQGALVAYVKDTATGQVAVMRAVQEIVVTDKALVASISKHLR